MVKVNNLPPILKKNGLKEKLEKICEINDVVFLAIFGSYVRGQQKKTSDIDIAIEFDNNKNKNLLDLIHLLSLRDLMDTSVPSEELYPLVSEESVEYELRKIFRKRVDLGTFSSISPYIIDDVKKQMRVIYEKG